jgi:hypothetical protein
MNSHWSVNIFRSEVYHSVISFRKILLLLSYQIVLSNFDLFVRICILSVVLHLLTIWIIDQVRSIEQSIIHHLRVSFSKFSSQNFNKTSRLKIILKIILEIILASTRNRTSIIISCRVKCQWTRTSAQYSSNIWETRFIRDLDRDVCRSNVQYLSRSQYSWL